MFCDTQGGFSRGTEDQVLRLTQSISDGFQAKPALRTILALLDFSKAYDRVWREDLLNTLLLKGISTRMVRWVAGFINNREAKVRLNGTLSRPQVLRQGLLQGSVLSPLLYLFVIDSLRDCIPVGVECSLYADDMALPSQSRNKLEAQAAVEAAVDAVQAWSLKKKLNLNTRPSTQEARWLSLIHI